MYTLEEITCEEHQGIKYYNKLLSLKDMVDNCFSNIPTTMPQVMLGCIWRQYDYKLLLKHITERLLKVALNTITP